MEIHVYIYFLIIHTHKMFTLIYEWAPNHSFGKRCSNPRLCFQCTFRKFIKDYQDYYLESKECDEKVDWDSFRTDVTEMCIDFGIGFDTELIHSISSICKKNQIDHALAIDCNLHLSTHQERLCVAVSRGFRARGFEGMLENMEDEDYGSDPQLDANATSEQVVDAKHSNDLRLITAGIERL